MTIPARAKPRERRPEQRRQDLLDAAVKVFTAKGVRDATVAEISETAGVAKGTFYLYFDSREHLLAALRKTLVEETLERAASYYERVGSEDIWSLVDGMTEAMIDLLYAQKDIIQAVTAEGMTPETAEVFAECDRKINAMIAAGIRMGIEQGEFHVANPEATASLLSHGTEGAVVEAILYDSGLTKQEITEAAKEMARKVLAPSKSKTPR
ncbi:MAG: TetR/AcrR family transcriptional regulator [Actinomycetota bacterium]|nr:TetR/AcrR family transcriptional regulator [Actinomycetota bacterium]